ncbi:invasion associated locus B family protein [Prosthecodimorpha staleyi]|uniref:Invasion associated locus B family protein n=1 Tax=Prosthecodimorpha staleyi TaxID=2840188 RepID=A0A947D4J4_9HYPH|nr:invasion associated locus B family protein [Prosthecodimorpha staleyi]MBT9290686.1 invasion associated locus B family protein [Prosthecodimorpha staleyi]
MKRLVAVLTACAGLWLTGATGVRAQAAAGAAPQPSSLQETYDDWLVVCRTLADAKRQCSMVQNQVDGKTKQRVLALELAAGPDRTTLTAVLPFGLDLAAGIVLASDDGGLRQVLRFRTCLPVGCVVPAVLDAKAVATLKKARLLLLTTSMDNGQPLELKGSLKGFPAAYDRVLALTTGK